MSEVKKMCPTVLDETVYAKCKEAMDKWSAGRAFSMTTTLGADAVITKAVMYHAYEFKLESRWTHREFTLENSGTPVSSPKGIDSYDLWDAGIHGMDDDCRLELSDTCYKEKCENCDGKGEYTCTKCHGDRKITCPTCGGSGEFACEECHGKGVVDCEECGGKGRVYCPHCNGGGKIGVFQQTNLNSADCSHCGHTGVIQCPSCGGSRHEECHNCHGSGRDTCTECHGDREVECPTCEGSGIETCPKCSGRGWNPHVWYLTQEQKSDAVAHFWFDEGIAEQKNAEDYASYVSSSVIDDERADGERTQQALVQGIEAHFSDELKTLWKDSDGKLEMASGKKNADRFRYQHAVLKQYDAVVRVEYTYKDRPYVIWIDFSGDKVFEGLEGGLMAEWAKEVAEGGDKAAAAGDTPEAFYKYTMACAITDNDTEISQRANKYLNRQAWFFRAAAALALLVWWGGFGMRTMGESAVAGAVYAAFVFVLGDWVALRRKWWLSSIGQLMVLGAGYVGYSSIVGENASNLETVTPMTDFALGCSLSFGSLVLLLAHDYALRFRGGKVAHKWIMLGLGALVGWAASPAIALGCSKSVALWGVVAKVVGIVLMGLAAWRTMARFRVIDCGKWIDRIKKLERKRAFVNSFAELKPVWLMKGVVVTLLAWIPISIGLSFIPAKDAGLSTKQESGMPTVNAGEELPKELLETEKCTDVRSDDMSHDETTLSDLKESEQTVDETADDPKDEEHRDK